MAGATLTPGELSNEKIDSPERNPNRTGCWSDRDGIGQQRCNCCAARIHGDWMRRCRLSLLQVVTDRGTNELVVQHNNYE